MLKRALSQVLVCRHYATRRRARVTTPVIDIESQVSDLPEAQRRQILEQAHGEVPQVDHTEVGADDFTANLIIEFLENAESPADLDAGFWKSVRGLAKSATLKRNADYLDLYAALFDSAKSIPDPKQRQDMLYVAGRYIYQQKQVRMDPVNEVEFLDTLVAKGRVFNALSLWRSRNSKQDVVGSVYWSEVGALYHIEAGLLRSADAMAVQMTEDLDGYTPPRVVVALIEAYSRQIRRGRDVLFAQKRLEAWATKLLSASMIYRHASIEHDEPVDVEAKLQERKEVSQDDISRLLTAVVAARQWSLAARICSSFDDYDNESLMQALMASNNSKHSVEESVMPFLDQILTQDPSRVSDARVTAALAVSLARAGDLVDMAEILKDMSTRQLELPATSQSFASKAILANRSLSLSERISTVRECLTSPAAAREVIRSLRRNFGVGGVAQFWSSYDGEIDSSLALEILRANAVKDEASLLRLGVSMDTWMYIWYLIASKKVSLDTRIALRAMLDQVDRSTLALDKYTMSYMIPAVIVSGRSVAAGVAEACAVLNMLNAKYNVPFTHFEALTILETTKRLVNGQKALFSPPPKQKHRVVLFNNDQESSASLDKTIENVSKLLSRRETGPRLSQHV